MIQRGEENRGENNVDRTIDYFYQQRNLQPFL